MAPDKEHEDGDRHRHVGWGGFLCRRCSGGLLTGKDLHIETDLIDG